NVVAVDPGARRRGIGTALVAAACEELRRRGCAEVSAGGGGPYLWPGIPRDIAGVVELFAAAGWRFAHEVHDLTRSLTDFVTPQQVIDGAGAAGVTFGRAVDAERELLVALA